MKVKSKKRKREFKPKEILDIMNLHSDFQKMNLESIRDNLTGWIELLEDNNKKVREFEPKYYLRDDFLMITHVFPGLPKSKYELYVLAKKGVMKRPYLERYESAHQSALGPLYKQEDEETSIDAFYEEENQSGQGPPFKKKTHHLKKRFKGECNECGKQGQRGTLSEWQCKINFSNWK